MPCPKIARLSGLALAMAALPAAASNATLEKTEIGTYGDFQLSETEGRCALESIGPDPWVLLFSGDGGNRLVLVMRNESWPSISPDSRVEWRFGPDATVMDMSGGSPVEHGFSVALENDAPELLAQLSGGSDIAMWVNGAPFAAFAFEDMDAAISAFRACHQRVTGKAL